MAAERDDAQAFVVGAGIAGLAAAHRLAAAGVDVTVLEADDRPGGRVSTLDTADGPMERGAQFLSTGYTLMPELLSAAGLADQVVGVSGRSMVLAGGDRHGFDTSRLGTLLSGGLVQARDVLPAARGMMRSRRLAHRDTADLGQWADLDDINGQTWSTATFGTGLTDRLLSPTVLGLFFHALSASSAAIPGALAAFQAQRARAITLRGGLGQLPTALAARLHVEYGVRVQRVVRDGNSVVLTTNRGRRRAASVVLAMPAKPTAQVLADPTPQELAVLSVPYSRGLLIGLALHDALAPGELEGAYGVLVGPDETTPLAAVAVRSRADAGAGNGDLLTVMLRPSAVERWWTADDGELRAVAIGALSPFLSGLRHRVVGAYAVRWEEAMPSVSVGHVAAVTAYRHGVGPTDPVVLAGDYLGFPWTDSAAFNGRWAADHLLSR